MPRGTLAITSIQVDGGSEFMAEFEDACAAMRHELQKAVTKCNTYRPHRA